MIAKLIERTATTHDIPTERITYTIYAGNRIESGCVTVLLFAGDEPLSVCRIARQDNSVIADEHRTLERVTGLVAGTDLERTVETPTVVETVAGKPVLFKPFIEGTLASVLLEPGERLLKTDENLVRRILLSSTRWLIALHQATRDHHDARRAAKREKIKALGCPPQINSASRFIEDESFVLAPTHGDLSTHNILMHGGETLPSVIDFEHFIENGPPMLDLFYLLLYVGRGIYGETPASVQKVFFDDCKLSTLVSECVSLYCDGLGISLEGLKEVLALCVEIRLERRRRLDFSAGTESLDILLRDRLVADADSVVW